MRIAREEEFVEVPRQEHQVSRDIGEITIDQRMKIEIKKRQKQYYTKHQLPGGSPQEGSKVRMARKR